ncbi:hypothetical protein CPB84DRAFT_1790737 [Gymnopilus junonius]|uniref:Uncharacterized protein n=1 Tax=Gymnopilus junonius TaxID=109634 RepID=A0A9P5NFT2_GYMJU|nr:hypothetical protein CPB84DRAFT_1790737 [Gymnopilus junonius]
MSARCPQSCLQVSPRPVESCLQVSPILSSCQTAKMPKCQSKTKPGCLPACLPAINSTRTRTLTPPPKSTT